MSNAEERLGLIKKRKSSILFNLLFVGFPMTKNELEFIFLDPGKSGNSHIRDSVTFLEEAKYIKAVPEKRKAVKRAGISKLANPHPNLINKYKLELKFGSVAKNLPRYRITPRFLRDMAELVKVKPKESFETVLNEILARMQIDKYTTHVPFNYREEKNINNIKFLQSIFMGWFIEREYISAVFRKRRNIFIIADQIELRKQEIAGITEDIEKTQNHVNKVLEENLYLFKEETVGNQNENRMKSALQLCFYLPKDKVLEEINNLFVYTNPELPKLARAILKDRWKLIQKQEGDDLFDK